MNIELDVPKTMIRDIEEHLCERAIEIDGHIERSTLADQALSRMLAAARKAGWGKKGRKKA